MPSDQLPLVLTWQYKRIDTSDLIPPVDEDQLQDAHAVYGREIEVERDEAHQTLEDISVKLEKRSRYYRIKEVVLGVEKYIEADIYCRYAYDTSLDDVLDVDITVIPEDVIRPVIPAEKRREEYLEEEDDAE